MPASSLTKAPWRSGWGHNGDSELNQLGPFLCCPAGLGGLGGGALRQTGHAGFPTPSGSGASSLNTQEDTWLKKSVHCSVMKAERAVVFFSFRWTKHYILCNPPAPVAFCIKWTSANFAAEHVITSGCVFCPCLWGWNEGRFRSLPGTRPCRKTLLRTGERHGPWSIDGWGTWRV